MSSVTSMHTTGEARIRIDAPAEVVYDLISDVERMGEWSPECYRTTWHPPHSHSAPGASFQGYNRSGTTWWEVPCLIVTADRGRRFQFCAPAGSDAATTWTYEIERHPDHTAVTEHFDAPMLAMPDTPAGQIPDRRAAMIASAATTLHRIKAAAEGLAIAEPTDA